MGWNDVRRLIAGFIATRLTGRRIVIDGTGPDFDAIQFFSGIADEVTPGSMRVVGVEGQLGVQVNSPTIAGGGESQLYLASDNDSNPPALAQLLTDGTVEITGNNGVNVRAPGASGFVFLDAENVFVNADPTAGAVSLTGGAVNLFPDKQPWLTGWSTTGAGPSFGNANIDAQWWDLGQFAFFRLRIIWGNLTTFGTGLWSFSLPFTPIGINQTVTALANVSAGGIRYTGSALINAADGISRISFAPGGTSGAGSTNPVAWTTNDSLIVQGLVEKV